MILVVEHRDNVSRDSINSPMTLFKFLVTTLVTLCNFLKSYSLLVMKAGKAKEAKLHTATSSGAEYSMISVHKLEDLMVPKFC